MHTRASNAIYNDTIGNAENPGKEGQNIIFREKYYQRFCSLGTEYVYAIRPMINKHRVYTIATPEGEFRT